MSFYLGDVIQVEYKVDGQPSIYSYYKITGLRFENGQTVYVLRQADGVLERDIFSKLIDSESIFHRKVMDGSASRNYYEG